MTSLFSAACENTPWASVLPEMAPKVLPLPLVHSITVAPGTL